MSDYIGTPIPGSDELELAAAEARERGQSALAAYLEKQRGQPAKPNLETMTTEQLRTRAAKLAKRAELPQQIAALEAERKFASAGILKSQLLQLSPVDCNGHPID